MKKSLKTTLLALSMSTLLAPNVVAADLQTYSPEPTVQGSVTLYGWYMIPGGDITIDDQTVGIGGGDGSILDILDGFFMADGEIRYGEFGIFGDVVYAGLSDDFTNGGWELDALLVTGLFTYDMMRSPTGFLQAGVGMRYWEIDASINIGQAGGARDTDWVDFVGGFRGQQYLSETVYVEGFALAGFGGSQFMWDAYGGLGYSFSSNFSATLGYRGMGVDYDQGAVEYGLTFHGPVAGLTLRF